MQQPPNPNPQNRQFQQQPPQQSDYTQPQTYYPPQQQWQQPQMPPQQQWNPQQPPFPQPQYPFPPPQYTPPPPAPKKLLRNKWFWITIVGVIVLISGISALANGGKSNPTPTPVATQSTQQAIQTPAKPTTPPTKPTPVSIQSQVQQLAQKSGTYTHADTATYDTQFKEAYITESFPLTGDSTLDVPRIKGDAYAIQKAIWQAHVNGLGAVMVMFNSDTDGTRLATCLLDSRTAATLQWASISPNQAWTACDGWLSPGLGA